VPCVASNPEAVEHDGRHKSPRPMSSPFARDLTAVAC
jgi:hypothetical protein